MGETLDSLLHVKKRQRANDPSQWPIPAGNRRQPTKKAPFRVPFLLAGGNTLDRVGVKQYGEIIPYMLVFEILEPKAPQH